MDNLTKSQRKKNMRNIRSSMTRPEIIVIKELKKRKFNFIINDKSIFGKPDIVFRRKKVAIFIDSDFWHGHPTRFIMPKTNRKYWRKKIENNRNRDVIVNYKLKRTGWKVVRLWEYNVKKQKDKCVEKIIRCLRN